MRTRLGEDGKVKLTAKASEHKAMDVPARRRVSYLVIIYAMRECKNVLGGSQTQCNIVLLASKLIYYYPH